MVTERRRHRTIAALVVALVAPAVLAPAPAAADGFDPSGIVFPVIGAVRFIDDFDQSRGDHIHGATDIMSEKLNPVVAAADGVVDWIGSTCCYLSIDHGGGWETWYIHLNNDSPGTDDGLGWGIAEGITVGTPVAQGQLIGWVGDSGNAEWVGSHLHFEIRKDGEPIDPYPYLLVAPRLTAPGTLVKASYSGQFRDDDGSVHEADIDALYQRGVTRGCAADLYCPGDEITRGQMAAFIRRTLALPASPVDYFIDDAGHIFEDDIDAITAAGIGFGCTETEFCVDRPLRRDEMAELLVRTFQLPAAATDYFGDDGASPFEASMNALKQANITYGCDPDDETLFCPDRHLTRAEMASFFIRSFDVLGL